MQTIVYSTRGVNLRSPETCKLENTLTSPLLSLTLSTNATYFFRVATSLALKIHMVLGLLSNSWLSCWISTKPDLHGSLSYHGSSLYSWELITAVIVESLMNTSLHVFIFKMCPIGPWGSTTVYTSITEDCRYMSFNVANNAIHVPCHLRNVILQLLGKKY